MVMTVTAQYNVLLFLDMSVLYIKHTTQAFVLNLPQFLLQLVWLWKNFPDWFWTITVYSFLYMNVQCLQHFKLKSEVHLQLYLPCFKTAQRLSGVSSSYSSFLILSKHGPDRPIGIYKVCVCRCCFVWGNIS